MQLDINLHNAELECDGGTRPDRTGVRLSFAGPGHPDGRRLRMIFGIAGMREATDAHTLATNLTVIFEGQQKVFATRGDDKCTVDQLTQERMSGPGHPGRSYRVIARGFCIAPVPALQGMGAIVISSFDFAGRVTFEDEPSDNPPAQSSRS